MSDTYVRGTKPDGTSALVQLDANGGLVVSGLAGGAGSPNSLGVAGGATYAITKDPSGSLPRYVATDALGTVVAQATDTATTSGLKAVIEGLAAADVHFRFVHTPANGAFTRFHLLDCPLGSESWNGGNGTGQDHLSFVNVNGLTFSGEGWRKTIVSSRTNVTTGADVEVLSFTNCQRVHLHDLQFETCGAFKSTTDCLDFDTGCNVVIERVRIIRGKSRGIVIDGGNPNKVARDNSIRDCIISGRPPAPELGLIAQAGGLAANTYRYAVCWTDADLLGPSTPGDTMPSDWVAVTTTAGSTKVDVFLPLGPYSCTGRKVLRWDSTNGWRLLTTVADNTTTVYRDDGTATPSAYTITDLSTIPGAGIEYLGVVDSLISGNFIDGVGGDVTGGSLQGTNQYGINIVRKATVPTSADRNRIVGNLVRKPTSHGIRISGGSDNIVLGNTILNPGIPATKAQGIRIEGIAGLPTDRNLVIGNVCRDTQDANTPIVGTPGASMGNAITVTATNTPTDNVLLGNALSGSAAAAISDAGTATRKRDNKGYVAENWGATSVATGGTIAHGLATTPLRVTATPSVAGEMVVVTALGTTTFTVALTKNDGTAGSTQTVYWEASL